MGLFPGDILEKGRGSEGSNRERESLAAYRLMDAVRPSVHPSLLGLADRRSLPPIFARKVDTYILFSPLLKSIYPLSSLFGVRLSVRKYSTVQCSSVA